MKFHILILISKNWSPLSKTAEADIKYTSSLRLYYSFLQLLFSVWSLRS